MGTQVMTNQRIARHTRIDRDVILFGNTFDDIIDPRPNTFGRNAVCLVIGNLLFAPTVGFINCVLKAVGHFIRIKQHTPINVTCRPPDGLHQRCFRPKEPFLIRIQNRYQRTFGNIQPFAQQVNPDQNVKHAKTQIADNLDPLQRINIGMQIPHPNAMFMQIFGQILGHALGQGRDQNPLPFGGTFLGLPQQIVNLRFDRPNNTNRIDQTGGTDHLLGKHAPCAFHFPFARCCRHKHALRAHRFPFFEF